MGLNLSFSQETPAYLAVAKCAEARKIPAEIKLWYVQKGDLPEGAEAHIISEYCAKDNKEGVVSRLTFDYNTLPLNIRSELIEKYPVFDDDYDCPDKSPYIDIISQYDKDWKGEGCKGCPLCPSDNFTRCYPRMGSYSYVASLADFVDATGSPLRSNLFVRTTEPGGYRIDTPDMKQKEREVVYRAHITAIEVARRTLKDTPMDCARLFTKGSSGAGHLAAEEQKTQYGFNWYVFGGSEGAWGVHRGRGIYQERTGTYYRSIEKIDGQYHAVKMDGTSVELTGCPLMNGWGEDEEVTRIEFTTIPAINNFDHLLDTAQTTLELALRYHLEVMEC